MKEKIGIATETLAELYLKGQNLEKAYKIYRQLLKQNPTNVKLKEKVRQLELLMRVPSGGGEPSKEPTGDVERAIGEPRAWLNRIQQTKGKTT